MGQPIQLRRRKQGRFTKLNGIVGIFGKNYSGKSSIIDGLLYTLFNSTSKNERKNLNVINQNKDYGVGKLEIAVGQKDFLIERESTKYIKKLKGEETLEAKTDINFSCYDHVTHKKKNSTVIAEMAQTKTFARCLERWMIFY